MGRGYLADLSLQVPVIGFGFFSLLHGMMTITESGEETAGDICEVLSDVVQSVFASVHPIEERAIIQCRNWPEHPCLSILWSHLPDHRGYPSGKVVEAVVRPIGHGGNRVIDPVDCGEAPIGGAIGDVGGRPLRRCSVWCQRAAAGKARPSEHLRPMWHRIKGPFRLLGQAPGALKPDESFKTDGPFPFPE